MNHSSEQCVSDTQWPVAGRAELGELAFDVHIDDAEEVVLAVRQGDIGQDLVVDAAAGTAHRVHRQPAILREHPTIPPWTVQNPSVLTNTSTSVLAARPFHAPASASVTDMGTRHKGVHRP